MTMAWQEQLRPGEALRGIMQQATAALIAMDAERLEELARCCIDLNREMENPNAPGNRVPDTATATAIRDAGSDLAVFESILFETRANLTVLSRLHANRRAEAAGSGSASRARMPDLFRIWSPQERKVDYGDN